MTSTHGLIQAGGVELWFEQRGDGPDVLLIGGLGIEAAHIAGFSGGSVTAQELALRHPERVRSLVLQSTWGRFDEYREAAFRFWSWMADAAPGEREMLEAFFLWVYTPRAHNDGTVAQIVEDSLAFPHPQSA